MEHEPDWLGTHV